MHARTRTRPSARVGERPSAPIYPVGTLNRTAPCSRYELGPGSSLAISPVHSHGPEAGSCGVVGAAGLCTLTHPGKEPHGGGCGVGGCSRGSRRRIRRSWAGQAQLAGHAKPRRLSSTSRGASVPPPQAEPGAHCLRVILGRRKGSASVLEDPSAVTTHCVLCAYHQTAMGKHRKCWS